MLRRMTVILLALMLSLVTTATVHAQEFSGTSVLECTGFVHSKDDSDQSQGDADKAVPHHHTSCQNAHAFIPASALPALLLRPACMILPGDDAVLNHRWSSGPGLRPPIA